jgi:hypothetical protein
MPKTRAEGHILAKSPDWRAIGLIVGMCGSALGALPLGAAALALGGKLE